MFEWQQKKCKCLRTFDFDYVATSYKIKILHEYHIIMRVLMYLLPVFITSPSLPF